MYVPPFVLALVARASSIPESSHAGLMTNDPHATRAVLVVHLLAGHLGVESTGLMGLQAFVWPERDDADQVYEHEGLVETYC